MFKVMVEVKEGDRRRTSDAQWQGKGRQGGRRRKVNMGKTAESEHCHHTLSTVSLLPLCQSVTLDTAGQVHRQHSVRRSRNETSRRRS